MKIITGTNDLLLTRVLLTHYQTGGNNRTLTHCSSCGSPHPGASGPVSNSPKSCSVWPPIAMSQPSLSPILYPRRWPKLRDGTAPVCPGCFAPHCEVGETLIPALTPHRDTPLFPIPQKATSIQGTWQTNNYLDRRWSVF